ncbi:MAG TPA: crosslink repair DNA glycosylase YcaQ family protein [Acidimicrobiia bacterium]|nr:crosslink repair DNA glycosylase YcaQ family protein [Acidimicrobiia bacterium]
MHELSLAEARRIAVRAQMLDAERPTDLVTLVEQLTLLQVDPTAAIAPNADLVAWSRLGRSYQPEHLKAALEAERTLYEHDAMIRPMSYLPLHLPAMAVWPRGQETRNWLEANDRFRRNILEQLATDGPLLSSAIPDTSEVAWKSTGWTNNRNVTQMLECLMSRGEVAIVGRVGRQRIWDLAERVYPADVPPVPLEEAIRSRNARRLGALGIARETGPDQPMEPYTVGEAGEPAVVDGVPGTWRVDPDALGKPFTPRTALLSPFDRLVHDRRRALELFDFEYTLEMYKPATQRRWGYFALPILRGDQLVGKLDAKADRKAGVLVVNAIHQDLPFTKATTKAVNAEIEDLAAWLGLELSGP